MKNATAKARKENRAFTKNASVKTRVEKKPKHVKNMKNVTAKARKEEKTEHLQK